MGCEQIGLGLAAVGLAFELGAVFRVLWGVGLGDWVKGKWRSLGEALWRDWNRLRRFLRRGRTVEGGPVHLSGSADIAVGTDAAVVTKRRTDLPAPHSLEEVGERLNRIAADLNEHERAINAQAESVRGEIGETVAAARSEWQTQHAALDELVREEIRRRLVERRTEAGVFAGGLLIQLAGITLLLVC